MNLINISPSAAGWISPRGDPSGYKELPNKKWKLGFWFIYLYYKHGFPFRNQRAEGAKFFGFRWSPHSFEGRFSQSSGLKTWLHLSHNYPLICHTSHNHGHIMKSNSITTKLVMTFYWFYNKEFISSSLYTYIKILALCGRPDGFPRAAFTGKY